MKEFTGYMHGVNLGGWLSQCNYKKEHCDSFILENDIKIISEWKLDHVRLPVDYNLFQAEDGSFLTAGFEYVDNCISWCKKYNLNMILDLHKTAGFSFDAKENEIGFFDDPVYQEKFYSLWEEFSRRYSKYENMMCFELLNEVTDPSFSPKWNAIAKKCVERIRKIAPTIKILIGSYWNNSVKAVKDMDYPYDENIVYNFHCYEPLIFTHQGARWLGKDMNGDFKMKYKEPFTVYTENTKAKLPYMQGFEAFGDKVPDPSYFETIFSEALKVAEERNVILYCGEYGVIDNSDSEEITLWYKDISEVLNKYNIGRAAWTYKGMSFGVNAPRYKEIIKFL